MKCEWLKTVAHERDINDLACEGLHFKTRQSVFIGQEARRINKFASLRPEDPAPSLTIITITHNDNTITDLKRASPKWPYNRSQ